ncbi:unnamed protein product [Peniophora sp. CBMAI 1063]|nr:unnamed protein product [Peniophora sp. CBMAI 1063]
MDVEPSSFIGPYLAGCNINWFLLGTLAVQIYLYETGRQKVKDAVWLRALVYIIALVDTVQAIITTRDLWFFSIDVWGNDAALLQLTLGQSLILIFGGSIAFAVQLFYAWRIWVLSQSKTMRVLTCIIVMLSMMQFAVSIHGDFISLSQYRHHGSIAFLHSDIAKLDVLLWLVGSFAADVLITSCMVWLLYRARTRTIWAQSQTLYDRLIMNTVQTGMVTVIAAGACLALWEIQNRYYLVPAIVIGKLYSNSFLSTLNGRLFRRDDSARQKPSALSAFRPAAGILSRWRGHGKSDPDIPLTGIVDVHHGTPPDRVQHVDGRREFSEHSAFSIQRHNNSRNDNVGRDDDKSKASLFGGDSSSDSGNALSPGSEYEHVIGLSSFPEIPGSVITRQLCTTLSRLCDRR